MKKHTTFLGRVSAPPSRGIFWGLVTRSGSPAEASTDPAFIVSNAIPGEALINPKDPVAVAPVTPL